MDHSRKWLLTNTDLWVAYVAVIVVILLHKETA
jgi:hypothetical protein